MAGGGEPGGEGGMSRLGIGGRVRSRISERLVEYGDCGREVAPFVETGERGGPEGPTNGPWVGALSGAIGPAGEEGSWGSDVLGTVSLPKGIY